MLVVGPMTDRKGLGWRSADSLGAQNAGEQLYRDGTGRPVRLAYSQLQGLPGTLSDVDAFVQQHKTGAEAVAPARWLLGFVLGFTRRTPVHSPGNLVDPTLLNVGQEQDLYGRCHGGIFVARNVFVVG